jgi:hypothetical protein
MHNVVLAFAAAWRVLLASLVLGAGLPMLFALGIRALSFGASGEVVIRETGVTSPAPHPLGRLLGGVCFAVVLMAVALGITFIVASGFGKMLSFEHVYPTIVDKH